MYLKWGKKMISAGIYSCGNYFKIELQRNMSDKYKDMTFSKATKEKV